MGLRFGWPALIVAAKPTLPFFLLIGANRRSWWIGLGVIALVGLGFGRLWLDWISVVIHAPGGVLYSIPNVPGLLMPVIAWLARRSGDATAADDAPRWGLARSQPMTGLGGTIVAVRRRTSGG